MPRYWLRWWVVPALAGVLGVPFFFRPPQARIDPSADRVIIITPHDEQIRSEFSHAFNEWYQNHFGKPVHIDWRTPGGTSEIRRQLIAEYEAALRRGPIRPESMSYDLLFGGGSYEHIQLKRPQTQALRSPLEYTLERVEGVYLPEGKSLPDHYVPGGACSFPVQFRLPDQVTIEVPSTSGPGAGSAALRQADDVYRWVETRVRIVPDTGIDLPAGTRISSPIGVPTEFGQKQLDEWYGENKIGRNTLYDPSHYWFGTALSDFGIVYNRDVLAELGIPEPTTWADMTSPALIGWVALADPGQSGSIATTYDIIIQRLGWIGGWNLLREAAANSRYFADSSSKVPIDVSMGEAAMGMCIDFYGRTQAGSLGGAPNGGADRVGYVDPARMSDIDADPITMLRGGPHPEVARRFIEFCLSVPAQALWQFPVRAAGASGLDDLGPVQFELRRLPIRRVMYQRYFDRFIDKVNPYALADPIAHWNFDTRTMIAPLFSAMAIDNRDELQEAWKAINSVSSHHPHLAEMKALFYAMPSVTLLSGQTVSLGASDGLKAIERDWASPQGRQNNKADRDRIAWTNFFRSNYQRIVRLARSDR